MSTSITKCVSFHVTGEGDSDTTEKKPESEPVNEDTSAKDNIDEIPEVPEEHTEL